MAGSKTFMIENAREDVLSDDLTRIGKLAGREQQDAEMARNARADFFIPGTFDDFGNTARDVTLRGLAEVIAGALAPASLQGQTGTFDMAIGAGEYQMRTNDVQPDMSLYQIARWAAQTITWPTDHSADPDASLYRIATIYVSPQDAPTDYASRNILLNVATRAKVPQNVYKTSNPSATFGVVAGTAASLPFPPPLPPNTIALFDVLIPPGSTQSSDWQITRRCSRRIEFPGSSQHGIVKGCVPTWNLTDETTGSPVFISLGSVVNRLVIDGELLTFGTPTASAFVVETADSINPPGAASATNDLPYYLYLCGGRNFPFCGGVTGATNNPYNATPVMLVASLTPPDAMGYPTAVMAVGGVPIFRYAAVYVGVGFVIANTSIHKCCVIEDDWVRAATNSSTLSSDVLDNVNTGFNESDVALTPNVGQSVPLNTVPLSSTMVEVEAQAVIVPFAGGAHMWIYQDGNEHSRQVANAVEQTDDSTVGHVHMAWRTALTTATFFVDNEIGRLSTMALNMYARAYNMNVPRLAR